MPDFPLRDFVAALPVTAAAVVGVLGVTFLVALRVGRHAVVDVAWGLGFVAVSATSYLLSAGQGDDTRRLLVLVLTSVWGLRLAWHIWRRSRGHGEDPRYDALLAKAPGSRTGYALRQIYLTQALVLWFVSLPLQVAAFQTPAPNWLTWLGVAVWAVGLFFEAVGDHQLHRFRTDPASKGKVLDTGLWRYTRHPNYFGDACVWWGLSLVAFSAWPGVLTLLSPVVMTWLLANGTGKPLLEKGMSSRRPGYDDYVARTSGFFPWPPRTSLRTHEE
jgi:steroid 5-alpha reductase family enzyme